MVKEALLHMHSYNGTFDLQKDPTPFYPTAVLEGWGRSCALAPVTEVGKTVPRAHLGVRSEFTSGAVTAWVLSFTELRLFVNGKKSDFLQEQWFLAYPSFPYAK